MRGAARLRRSSSRTCGCDASIAREMWEHTDFRVLYDPHRALFSIGYNLSEGRLDPSYYDLLASECRLASFLSVAKGDVDQEHWFRLGRSLTRTPRVARSSRGARRCSSTSCRCSSCGTGRRRCSTETYDTVVRRQIAYGAERGVPWGVSESAFNAKDAQLVYQYQAFGVPGLGLKRGLSDEVVVAPYASILALPIDPRGGGDQPRGVHRARAPRGRSATTNRSTTPRAAYPPVPFARW